MIVRRNAAGLNLNGFGILSDCDCKKTSLDANLFTNPFNDNFLIKDSLSTTAGGSAVSITVDLTIPDTVSSVCGNADGLT